jgi:hypothetical protein
MQKYGALALKFSQKIDFSYWKIIKIYSSNTKYHFLSYGYVFILLSYPKRQVEEYLKSDELCYTRIGYSVYLIKERSV